MARKEESGVERFDTGTLMILNIILYVTLITNFVLVTSVRAS